MPSDLYEQYRCGIQHLDRELGKSTAELIRIARNIGIRYAARYCPESDGDGVADFPTQDRTPTAGQGTDYDVTAPSGAALGTYRANSAAGAVREMLRDAGYSADVVDAGKVAAGDDRVVGEYTAVPSSGRMIFVRVVEKGGGATPQSPSKPKGKGTARQPDPTGVAESPAREAVSAYQMASNFGMEMVNDLDALPDYVLEGVGTLEDIEQQIKRRVGQETSYNVKHYLAMLGALHYGRNNYSNDQTIRLKNLTDTVVTELKYHCCSNPAARQELGTAWNDLKRLARRSRLRPAGRFGTWMADDGISVSAWMPGGGYFTDWIAVSTP